MNKLIIIGNLTRDPEFATTPNGVAVCKFRVAVGRSFKREGEADADFFNVVTWRGLADNCHKYLAKGRKVCVIGPIQFRNYEDNDGVTRTIGELIAENVEFLSANAATENKDIKPVDDVNNDLPF